MGNHFMRCGCGNHHRWGIGRIVALTVGGVVIACVFGLAFGWLVMILWNWLMPGLFGFKMLTYWQAFGIIILARLIVGSIGCHHPRHKGPPWHPHYHQGGEGWDEWAPAGDHRNWRYYREYWKERGRKDFEEYLKDAGHSFGNDDADLRSGPDSH
jgi:hypothetical protein